jgi:membrane protease YdiL (CAAX protease family)
MDQVEAVDARPAPREHRPRWKRIVDFPLVTLVLAVGLFILANAAATFLIKLLPPMERELGLVVNGLITVSFAIAMYKAVIAKLGDRKHDDLPVAEAPRGLAVGIAVGLLLFSAVVGVAALLDVYNILGSGGTGQLVFALVGMALVPGVMEEMLFRGILFRWIEEFAGSWAALLVTSALFGLAHITNPNATVFSSFAIAVEAGLLLGALYMLTRNLWAPIGLHAAWNFTQGEIYDVPVSGIDQHGLVTAQLSGPTLLSGGEFGLEASLIALVLATAVGLWFLVRAIRQGELVRPWWVRRRLGRDG